MLVDRRYRFGISFFAVLAVSVFSSRLSEAQDWPGWRGSDRSDRSSETGLLQEWPKGGPVKKWSFDKAGMGYAGFSVVNGHLFTLGEEGGDEFVICLDAETGSEVWRQTVSGKFDNNWGDGPRSTPTVDGNQVFSLVADGTLSCLNAKNGEIVWSKKLQDFGGSTPSWGYSESPLVDEGMVICTPGGENGSIIALDKSNGELKWQTEDLDSSAHYSSPIAMQVEGKKQYVQLLPNRAVGIQPDNGDVLWQSEWHGKTAVIPTAVDVDGKVYITSGYGAGARMINPSSEAAGETIWEGRDMKNHHGGVILVDGFLYGHSDKTGFVCQDPADGKLKWNNKDIDKGCVTWADGRFYYVEESTGNVLLLEANEEKLKLRGKFKMEPQTEQRSPDGAIWVHPVIAGGKLFVRDQEFIHCYDIRAEAK